jgi:hypothetical protein
MDQANARSSNHFYPQVTSVAHSASAVLRSPAVLAAVLFLVCGTAFAKEPAAAANACKTCSDQQSACMKNYAGPTCKTEYQICMKSCGKK